MQITLGHPDIGDSIRTLSYRGLGWRTRLGYESGLKRVLDVVLALLILTLTAPLWILAAVAIRLDSPGGALFVQERVGLQGRLFRMYKFRSMHVGAESRLVQLLECNEARGPVFKIRRDPRVTRVGRIIRRTSLDELPQLLNVVRGEMSLVGPRPPLPSEVALYRPADRIRLSVKPGITCLWQVRGRSLCDFDTWMEHDREYVSRLSMWLDLTILLRTVWVVLTCRGAY